MAESKFVVYLTNPWAAVQSGDWGIRDRLPPHIPLTLLKTRNGAERAVQLLKSVDDRAEFAVKAWPTNDYLVEQEQIAEQSGNAEQGEYGGGIRRLAEQALHYGVLINSGSEDLNPLDQSKPVMGELPKVEQTAKVQKGRQNRPDAGGKLKMVARRNLVFNYLDEECEGRWDGTLEELTQALLKDVPLKVSVATLSRDFQTEKGDKYRRVGDPHRSIGGEGEREAVTEDEDPDDMSGHDAYTMPDDDDSVS